MFLNFYFVTWHSWESKDYETQSLALHLASIKFSGIRLFYSACIYMYQKITFHKIITNGKSLFLNSIKQLMPNLTHFGGHCVTYAIIGSQLESHITVKKQTTPANMQSRHPLPSKCFCCPR